MGAVLAPAPVRRRSACLARTPSAARVKEEGAKVAEKFSRGAERGGESFLEVSDRLDAHSGRGCNGVARGRGLHVSWELQWGSLSTVAADAKGQQQPVASRVGGKRERRQSTLLAARPSEGRAVGWRSGGMPGIQGAARPLEREKMGA